MTLNDAMELIKEPLRIPLRTAVQELGKVIDILHNTVYEKSCIPVLSDILQVLEEMEVLHIWTWGCTEEIVNEMHRCRQMDTEEFHKLWIRFRKFVDNNKIYIGGDMNEIK